MSHMRVEADRTESDYVELDFSKGWFAKQADQIVMFSGAPSESVRLARPSDLPRIRSKLEASGLTWSESESGFSVDDVENISMLAPEMMDVGGGSRYHLELIEEEDEERELSHWKLEHEYAEVGVVGRSRHPAGQGFDYVGSDRATTSTPSVGDLFVEWTGETPTRSNQILRRVERLLPVGWHLGPAIPRSEWPDNLRDFTSPSTVSVTHERKGESAHISLVGAGGSVLFSYVDDSRDPRSRRDLIAEVVEEAADMGRDDAERGRSRSFDVVKSSGTDDPSQSWWKMVDAQGQGRLVEPRRMFAHRPSEFVHAVLIATRAAYADGMKEGLERKASRDAVVSSPGM